MGLEESAPEVFRRIMQDDHWHLDDYSTQYWFFSAKIELLCVQRLYIDPMYLSKRIQKLFDYLVKSPGPFYQQYLSRVARCYVYDLQPELMRDIVHCWDKFKAEKCGENC